MEATSRIFGCDLLLIGTANNALHWTGIPLALHTPLVSFALELYVECIL